MSMSLEQLNEYRKSNGQEPLTELPEALGGKKKEEGATGGEGEGMETPEQIEAKRLAAEEEANKNKVPELTDEQVMAFLNKRGIPAASLDELKPKEQAPDPAALAEQREADELAYGLSKGLFKKADYDAFVSDMKDPQVLVFADFYQEAKTEDPTLTDEDIQAEFEAKYGLDAEKDSRKWKRGAKEIKDLAKAMINAKHSKILSAKDAFSKHEKSSADAAATQKKITAALPMYRADVEEAFAELKKIPVKFSDTETYEVQAMEEHLNELKAEMLTPEYVSNTLSAGYDKVKMKQSVKAAFLYNNWTVLAKEVTKQVLEKHAAGGRGVDLTGGKQDRSDAAPELTAAQKKLVQLNKEAAAAN